MNHGTGCRVGVRKSNDTEASALIRFIHVNIDFLRMIKLVRILGLMALISYMIVILFTWIYANFKGFVYFSAGEPILLIKYPEWMLGFIGILVAIDYLYRELKGYYL